MALKFDDFDGAKEALRCVRVCGEGGQGVMMGERGRGGGGGKRARGG